MRIRRLYIGDFGILRNQTLDNLNSGLVVVGGCNRAGKSTFMQVLRYLGYGIPQSKSLPPANVEYLVEADITQEDTNCDYHIRLSGYGEPVCIAAGENKRVSAASIYGLDQFTYHNLFTISLDQLARVPEGITGKDVDRLQSALLGAGLADIANIPHLEAQFLKAANAIGGTDGRLTVKGFKPHVQRIREGVARKREALARVDEYEAGQKTLSDLKRQEKALRDEIQVLQARQDILELLRSNYEAFTELMNLESSLEDHEGAFLPDSIKVENRAAVEEAYKIFQEIRAQWQRQYDELAAHTGGREKAGGIVQLLVKHKASLQGFYDSLSGLREIWNGLDSLQNRLKEQRRQLSDRISRLNAGWAGDSINIVRDLKLDMIEESRLIEAADGYRGAEDRLSQAKSRLDEAKAKSDWLQRQLQECKVNTPHHYLKIYLWAFAASFAAGTALWFLNPYLGLFLGLFGLMGAGLYAVFKGSGKKEAAARQKELEAELGSSKALQERLSGEIKLLTDQKQAAAACLAEVRDRLGLPVDMGPDGILEYYRALSDIKSRLRWLESEAKEMDSRACEFTDKLSEIAAVLSEFDSTAYGSILSDRANLQSIRDIWHDIQEGIIKWHGLMEKAVLFDSTSLSLKTALDRLLQLSGAQDTSPSAKTDSEGLAFTGEDMQPIGDFPEEMQIKLSDVDSRIENYFNICRKRSDYEEKQGRRNMLCQVLERAAASERTQKASEILDWQYNSSMELFRQLYTRYPSREFAEREYSQITSHIGDNEEKLEACREEIHKTKTALEQLCTTDELERSHEMIQQGRTGLYQASYQYGVLKAAAWLCGEVKNGFMEKMKDELLRQADGVLNRLTRGEYIRILPGDDLSDFSFMLQDGSFQSNTDILSRGTREQVFLAVRLGRILDIKPALPVIIDDSFVNFDSAHLKEAVSILNRLSQTHQVFIMTCHPHLIEMLMDVSSHAQYWRLEKGHFTLSDGMELRDYLGKL